MNNVHSRLQNVRAALLDCLRTMEPGSKYVGMASQPMYLPLAATLEQTRVCRQAELMDQSIGGGLPLE